MPTRPLREAGHDPEVIHAHSLGAIPGALQTPTQKRVKQHTGKYWVPALETDGGEWIGGSKKIASWAEQHRPPPEAEYENGRRDQSRDRSGH